MQSRILSALVLACATSLAVVAAPKAPDVAVREATDSVLKMVQDPGLQGDAKANERRTAMIAVVDQFFDWELMSQLSMGKYWRPLTPEQQDEFVPVFKELIVSSYLGHVESYKGEKIVYEAPVVEADKGRAEVKVTVTTDAYGVVDILYRMYLKDGSWKVRDVNVLGVSLVRNYRTQLGELMQREDFPTVLERLRKKVAEQQQAGGAKLK